MAPLSTFYLSIFAISLVAFGSSRAIPQLVLCILLDLGMMRSRSVKLGFTFNVLLWSIIIWGVFLLFPFPLDVHAETFPFYAETRNLILRELNIYKYPLALNPSVHLQGLIWLLSNCFLMIYIRSHRKDEEISKINLGLIIIALCFCGFGWLQFLTDASHIYWFSGVPSFARERFFGTMINPNHASYFLGAILPLVFPHLGRHWAKYTLIFFVITIIYLGSRGALAATTFGSLIWFYFQEEKPSAKEFRDRLPHEEEEALKEFHTRRAVTLSLLMFIGISLFFTAQSKISWSEVTTMRTDIWTDTLHLLDKSPLLGLGFGGFAAAYPFVKSYPLYSHASHAHQEYLQILVDYGSILGCMLLFVLASRSLLFLYQKPDRTETEISAVAGLMVIAIGSIVDFPIRIGTICLLFSYYFSFVLPPFEIVHRNFSFVSMKTIQGGLLFLALFSLTKPTDYTLDYAGRRMQEYEPLRTNPLSEIELQRYLQYNPNGLLHYDLAKNRPNNIYSWLLLARYERAQENYENSCEAWEKFWTLEFQYANKKFNYIPEALACSPNTWLTILSLPEDSNYLTKAGKTLKEKKLYDLADFAYSRAMMVDDFGLDQYIWFLLERKRWRDVWPLLRDRPVANCQQAVNMGEFSWTFHFKETVEYLEAVAQYCGPAKWPNRLHLSKLRRGDSDALEIAKTDPRRYDETLHGLVVNKLFREACTHVRLEYLKQPQTWKIKKDLEDCEVYKYPRRFPLWILTPENEFEFPEE